MRSLYTLSFGAAIVKMVLLFSVRAAVSRGIVRLRVAYYQGVLLEDCLLLIRGCRLFLKRYITFGTLLE